MKIIFFILSFILVAFGGGAAYFPFLGIFAASIGYALFWYGTLQIPSKKIRFLVGFAWFTGAHLIQLSWFISHPYMYIYIIWFLLSVWVGLQFGLLTLLVNRERVKSLSGGLLIASVWTLFEWMRLLPLSGYSWNFVGLSLSSTTYSMQAGSLAGVFGLSFFVIFTNCLGLRAVILRQKRAVALFALFVTLPYFYGFCHLQYHEGQIAKKNPENFHAILVQTAFPVEEAIDFGSCESFLAHVKGEWRSILSITKQHLGKKTDLLVLPEFVVPYGAYTFVYPHQEVVDAFLEIYGRDVLATLPPLELPFARSVVVNGRPIWMVNNIYYAQAIANSFKASVAIGLEDVDDFPKGKREYYSAAIYVHPQDDQYIGYRSDRYKKRALVPMGEYIPYAFCQNLAAMYGVTGSFTPGNEAKVVRCASVPCGTSICYDETFGEIMRENRVKGAKIFVNLTSDAWYPHSRLPKQHLEHARLRTVENGIPLIRSCNTGVTTAVDSFGRDIAILGEGDSEFQDLADSIYVTVPLYSYSTLYTILGDGFIVGVSLLLTLLFLRKTR